jgi:hypothetical protein
MQDIHQQGIKKDTKYTKDFFNVFSFVPFVSLGESGRVYPPEP